MGIKRRCNQTVADRNERVVGDLNHWMWRNCFLPVWRSSTEPHEITGKPKSTLGREQFVDALIISMARVHAGRQVESDYDYLGKALDRGLKRRVGERLNSTAGRVYIALTALEDVESQRYGVCRLCHVVFEGRRFDARYCSNLCKDARLPSVPSEPTWVAVPGPRFAASLEDMRHRLVQTYCAGCGEPFFRPTDRHKYCKPACRQLAYRRRNAA